MLITGLRWYIPHVVLCLPWRQIHWSLPGGTRGWTPRWPLGTSPQNTHRCCFPCGLRKSEFLIDPIVHNRYFQNCNFALHGNWIKLLLSLTYEDPQQRPDNHHHHKNHCCDDDGEVRDVQQIGPQPLETLGLPSSFSVPPPQLSQSVVHSGHLHRHICNLVPRN